MVGVVITVFVTAIGLAAAAVFVFGPWRSRLGTAPSASRPSAPPSRAADTSPTAVRSPTFASLPAACTILPGDVVRRLVPTATPKIDKMGAETAGVCKYSFTEGRRFRAVQVDARAFLPKYMHDQATSLTIWSFEAQWRQAEKDLTADTSSLRRIGGLGDAAFERYWIDRDVHIAVGEATVRYRNVVLRVEYTEDQPSNAERATSEQRCLADAIAAARAGLGSLR